MVGTLDARLMSCDKDFQETVSILMDQACSLLSKRACEGLGLVKVSGDVHEVKEEVQDFRAAYSELFQGLGKLKTRYHITLQPGVDPSCLYVARKFLSPCCHRLRQN